MKKITAIHRKHLIKYLKQNILKQGENIIMQEKTAYSQPRLSDEELLAEVRVLSIKKVITVILTVISSLLLFIIMFFSFLPEAVGFIVFFLTAAPIVIGVFIYSNFETKTNKLVRENVVYDMLAENFEINNYDEKLIIYPATLREVIEYSWDNSISDGCFTAKYKELEFVFSNISLHKDEKDSDGDTISEKQFEGQWIYIDLDKEYYPKSIEGTAFYKLHITGRRAHILKSNDFIFKYKKCKNIDQFREKARNDVNYIKSMLDEFLTDEKFTIYKAGKLLLD